MKRSVTKCGSELDDDARWMAMALDAARRGVGKTSPNPPVGAVVIRDGQRVGMGYHHRAGQAHAEVLALKMAGLASRGATLYVTLEPCSTQGRTPPCTQAIVRAGIRRVVIGCRDPNPKHNGAGIKQLKAADIEVRVGQLRRECERLIEPFAMWIAMGRPLVTLKLAVSLDGRIADGAGQSRWITGLEARRRVRMLRSETDVVIVGAGTLRADDPSLLVSGRTSVQPRRVILTRSGRLPVEARVFTDHQCTRTVVFHSRKQLTEQLKTVQSRGVSVERLELPAEDGGDEAVATMLKRLGAMGVTHAVCEGGGGMAGSLLRADLVDRLLLFIAPIVLGSTGRPSVDGAEWPLSESRRWDIRNVQRVGLDVMIEADRRRQ